MSIQHFPQQSKFVKSEGSYQATLTYSCDNTAVEFTSTYVPFALRGRGIGEDLVKQGLLWAEQNTLSVTSSCWFVDRFLQNKQDK